MARPSVEPRMLNAAQAAQYCGMSATVFRNRCPVPATDFGDRRLELYDRKSLDAWLDARANSARGVTSIVDAMAEFRRANRGTREKP